MSSCASNDGKYINLECWQLKSGKIVLETYAQCFKCTVIKFSSVARGQQWGSRIHKRLCGSQSGSRIRKCLWRSEVRDKDSLTSLKVSIKGTGFTNECQKWGSRIQKRFLDVRSEGSKFTCVFGGQLWRSRIQKRLYMSEERVEDSEASFGCQKWGSKIHMRLWRSLWRSRIQKRLYMSEVRVEDSEASFGCQK